jgi:Rrf2 family transcriptional regulator, iron-sulfur cluster assembly transcription factor
MKLSTKGRYAVMAMADLASREGNGPVTLSEIADSQEISLAYLEQLFAKMRKSGLVDSTRGPGGGYNLSSASEDIYISDIIRAVDEPTRVTRCEIRTSAGCLRTGRCMTHDLWEALGHRLHQFLASISLADVVENRVMDMAGLVPFAHEEVERPGVTVPPLANTSHV